MPEPRPPVFGVASEITYTILRNTWYTETFARRGDDSSRLIGQPTPDLIESPTGQLP